MQRYRGLGWLVLIALFASACSHETEEVDTGTDAVTTQTETGVRVGSIQRGAAQPGRYRLGVRAAADDPANAVFFARTAALAYRDGLDPDAAPDPNELPLRESIAELGVEQYFFFDAKFTDRSISAENVNRGFGDRSDEPEPRASDGRSAPDAQGFVALVTPRDAADEKAVLISYRGTDSLRDALTDAWVSKTSSEEYGAEEGIEVHAGFKAQTEILWNAIEAQVWKLVIKPRSMRRSSEDAYWPVYFTGHSLGGAVAVMAASRVVSPKSPEETASLQSKYGAPPPPAGRGYPIGGVFTFGQPRVGNRAFVDALRGRFESTRQFRAEGIPYVRFYNGRDIVGRVPSINYAHGGLEVRIGGEAVACEAWEDPFRPGYSISDHYMKNYVASVDAAVARASAAGAPRLCAP